MGTQRVAGTKKYHAMQIATESKAVEKKFPGHEMENYSPDSKSPNLWPSLQNFK